MSLAPTASLFARHRNCGFISAIEKNFFNKLYKLRGQFSSKSISVDMALQAATSFFQSKDDRPLNIVVSFDLTTGRKQFGVDHMHLGTQLIPNSTAKESQVTHFIALTNGDTCKVKLHLDLDFDVDAAEPKPSPHLQVGGRPLKIATKTYRSEWDKTLDKPRWPKLPFCTPLLWHAAFLEFVDCESVTPFVHAPWWTKIVAEAEKSLWQPFAADMDTAMNKGQSVIEALYPPRA